jgi:hypothetical protein
VVENHRLCLDITQVLNVVLGILFNKTWDYVVIWIHVSVLQRSIDFKNEFYVHLLCEFFVVLDYDEMNCNLVYGVFYNVL